LPDDQLAELLKEKGYPIARRTIANTESNWTFLWQECGRRYKIVHLIFY
jgi:hypothetical protein